jgi:hypothetical protein
MTASTKRRENKRFSIQSLHHDHAADGLRSLTHPYIRTKDTNSSEIKHVLCYPSIYIKSDEISKSETGQKADIRNIFSAGRFCDKIFRIQSWQKMEKMTEQESEGQRDEDSDM